jgi:hypothetical protein
MCRVGLVLTVVADVADAVSIAVALFADGLSGIVSVAVCVAVRGACMGRVGRVRAVVAGVAEPVSISVRLIGVSYRQAIVIVIIDAVAVLITFTRIAHAIAVGVLLAGVGDCLAVVASVAEAVGVLVALFTDRFIGVIGITVPIAVGGNGMGCISLIRAVVANVAELVAVGV